MRLVRLRELCSSQVIMIKLLLIVIFVPAGVLSSYFIPCNDGDPVPRSVYAKNFNGTVYLVKLLKKLSVEVDFEVPYGMDHIRWWTRTVWPNMKTPIPLFPDLPSKPCDHLVMGKCPLEAGDMVSLKIKLPAIPMLQTNVPLGIEFKIADDAFKVLYCFMLPSVLIHSDQSWHRAMKLLNKQQKIPSVEAPACEEHLTRNDLLTSKMLITEEEDKKHWARNLEQAYYGAYTVNFPY